MATRTRTRARYRASSVHNRMGLLLAAIAVILLTTVVFIRSVSLYQKLHQYETRIESLQTQIDSEEARATDIEEFKKYTTTRKYIEEVAKEKLGLVYPGEIIFKDESQGK
ncbi:MAG: septum formation initiator family protein [Butyrivibrio sp.]|nr:septum formation initiator family protein [Butyrivibrio sp.]